MVKRVVRVDRLLACGRGVTGEVVIHLHRLRQPFPVYTPRNKPTVYVDSYVTATVLALSAICRLRLCAAWFAIATMAHASSQLLADPLLDAAQSANVIALLCKFVLSINGSPTAVSLLQKSDGVVQLLDMLKALAPESVNFARSLVQTAQPDPQCVALVQKATSSPLSASEVETVMRALLISTDVQENGRAASAEEVGRGGLASINSHQPPDPCSTCGLEPSMVPKLVDSNPTLVAELLAFLLHKPESCSQWGGVSAFLHALRPSPSPSPSPSPHASSSGPASTSPSPALYASPSSSLSLQLLEVVSKLLSSDVGPATTSKAQGGPQGGRKGATQAAVVSSSSTTADSAAVAGLSGLPPTHSLSVFTAPGFGKPPLPADFLPMFIGSLLATVATPAPAPASDKQGQGRQVRLVCAFLTSLVKAGLLSRQPPGGVQAGMTVAMASRYSPPPEDWEQAADAVLQGNGGNGTGVGRAAGTPESGARATPSSSSASSSASAASGGDSVLLALRAEVEAFCVAFSRTKEAAALYKLLMAS